MSSVGQEGQLKEVRFSQFYGWAMVGISFLVQCIGVGSQNVTGLFIQPIMLSYQVSYTSILVFTSGVMMLVAGVGSPFVGLLLQRYSIRTLNCLGVVCTATGYVGLGYATSFWQIAAMYTLLFSAGNLICNIAATTLVSNWFVTARGLALGISGAGFFAAGLIIPPMASYSMLQLGFSKTCLLLGLLIYLFIPLIFFTTVDKPENIGLLPDGKLEADGDTYVEEVDSGVGLSLRELLVNAKFWILSFVISVSSGISGVFMVNIVSFAIKAGIDGQNAAYLLSYSSVCSVLGTIIFGRLFDHIDRRVPIVTTIALIIVACVAVVVRPDYWSFLVASVCIGVGFGISTLMMSAMIAACFGRSSFSVAFGGIISVGILVYITLLGLVGWTMDVYGSYDKVCMLFVAILSTAMITSIFFLNKKAFYK